MKQTINNFTPREVKSVWEVTRDLRNGIPVSDQRFNTCQSILDRINPDLTYRELVDLAFFNFIIDEHEYEEERVK